MDIICKNISQEDFDYALECLMDCMQDDAKDFGFNYPYFTPGGMYGKQWWQLDSSLALSGYKWIDRKFAETSLWNFVESQKDDGRICLWGEDQLPDPNLFEGFSKQRYGVSSLPKIFDVTYHILKGSTDENLKKAAYNMLKKYLRWWFDCRLDKPTGLITAVFEETFIPYLGYEGEYAAVDTNVEVYVGCHYLEILAKEFGETEYSESLKKQKQNLKESINKYLWNDKKGAYYPYDVKKKESIDLLMASTFYPLRLNIATKPQKQKLLKLLKDHEHFNWDTIPLTSVSKKDKEFRTTKGDYQGNASWSGNVWTLINEMVVRGLLDCGEDEIASELALKTLKAFKGNYSEFINPFDGSGHGVKKYAWTASQFVELLVEVIFGVSYSASKNELVISPKLPKELLDCNLSLKNLKIDSDTSIDIHINCGKVFSKATTDKIKVVC